MSGRFSVTAGRILQGLGGECGEDKALEQDATRGIVRPRRAI
jgi:hypothetical protein